MYIVGVPPKRGFENLRFIQNDIQSEFGIFSIHATIFIAIFLTYNKAISRRLSMFIILVNIRNLFLYFECGKVSVPFQRDGVSHAV